MEDWPRDHRATDYRRRIAGRAGRPGTGLLPSAASEQISPTWIIDGIVNRTVRSRRRARFEATLAQLAAAVEVDPIPETLPVDVPVPPKE